MSSFCDLVYESIKDSGKTIRWTNATTGQNKNISNTNTYKRVNARYYVSYCTATKAMTNTSYYRAYGDQAFGTTNGSTRWIISSTNYAYKGVVTGGVAFYTNYYFSYDNVSNHSNYASIPYWDQVGSMMADSVASSKNATSYFMGMLTGVNSLVYTEVEDDLLMQPRGGSTEYVVNLVPNSSYTIVKESGDLGVDSMKITWTNPYDPNHYIGFTASYTDCNWLVYPLDIRNINLKKLKDKFDLNWKMSEGLPIYRADATTTYTLDVICPANGYFYFYNRTKNKITDWSALYTTLTTGTTYQVTSGVEKTFSLTADSNDWLAVVYLPTSGQQEITSMSMTKEN